MVRLVNRRDVPDLLEPACEMECIPQRIADQASLVSGRGSTLQRKPYHTGKQHGIRYSRRSLVA